MSARKETRGGKPTGQWYFRKQIQVGGESRRLWGYPKDYGQPNTQAGALAAEALAVSRALGAAPPAAGAVVAASVPAGSGRAPIQVAGREPTVADAAELWLAKSRADDKPSSTRYKVGTLRARILPRFGHVKLSELTGAMLEEWRIYLRDTAELTPVTIVGYLDDLRALLRYAKVRGLLAEVPPFPRQKLVEGPPKFLSFADADRLVVAADGAQPWQDLIVVALRTGLRIGELFALRWQDVDLDRGVLRVARNWSSGHLLTPKSGKSRDVPLSRDAIAVLRRRGPSNDPDALVFPDPNGRFLDYQRSSRALIKICRRAGLEPFGWHRLRHTFATHLVMRQVNPRTIQDLLGHATIDMTMLYMHAMPEFSRAAVNLLDADTPVTAAPPTSRSTRPTEPIPRTSRGPIPRPSGSKVAANADATP